MKRIFTMRALIRILCIILFFGVIKFILTQIHLSESINNTVAILIGLFSTSLIFSIFLPSKEVYAMMIDAAQTIIGMLVFVFCVKYGENRNWDEWKTSVFMLSAIICYYFIIELIKKVYKRKAYDAEHTEDWRK